MLATGALIESEGEDAFAKERLEEMGILTEAADGAKEEAKEEGAAGENTPPWGREEITDGGTNGTLAYVDVGVDVVDINVEDPNEDEEAGGEDGEDGEDVDDGEDGEDDDGEYGDDDGG